MCDTELSTGLDPTMFTCPLERRHFRIISASHCNDITTLDVRGGGGGGGVAFVSLDAHILVGFPVQKLPSRPYHEMVKPEAS